MKWKKHLIPALVLVAVLVFLIGGVSLRRMALNRVNEERKQQLKELTEQISDTFENELGTSHACLETIANLFAEGEYGSEAEIAETIKQMDETFVTEKDESEEERILFFLDENGICYDKNGKGGVWGDFDQVAGIEDSKTFVADSTTYEGEYWAFVRELETPVTTGDGKIQIRYAVLLKTVDLMSRYYKSAAYAEYCETYILTEYGTRMYDNVDEKDTIATYNIYKKLRESDSSYGGSFDEVEKELEENGVACGNYNSGEQEYCYALAWEKEYGVVLCFLIPTDAVAVNTVAMVSTMMVVFLIAGTGILLLMLISVTVILRLTNSRKIARIKEKNLEEIQKTNAQLAEANESLANANRAAKSALDIARSANRAKSSFLSNMSHDIRTPLNAIIGFLTLLEQNVGDPELVRQYTEKIQISSRHLLNLINDILDMSRIESGKTTLNAEPFSIGSLLDATQSVIEPQARERALNFTIYAENMRELVIEGDRLRMSQILLNLLSNAVKYTLPGGSVSLRVERWGDPPPGKVSLRFSVKDNGVGMSRDFQKRIFEPFEREKTSTENGVQGTGLGMAITKNLVDLMGGIIYVDSVQGEGSVFTVELPFKLAGENGEKKALSETEKADQTDTWNEKALDGCHFLIAEDNDINAEIIRELLAMENATCEIAVNGQEALKLFEQSEPGTYDAVFMDIQMPVMNGYEAASLIRASDHPDAARIPIAAMTANAFAEDVQKALEAGMNTHIPKPVDMNKIREFIAGEKEKEKWD